MKYKNIILIGKKKTSSEKKKKGENRCARISINSNLLIFLIENKLCLYNLALLTKADKSILQV